MVRIGTLGQAPCCGFAGESVSLLLGDPLVEAADLAGVKVMVIDDSNTIRRSAEIFLAQAGCQVILAEDGFDALAKITDHQPDVIFVDIMMPRLDGYQTCSLIKHNKVFRSIPVIMLSSKDGLFDRARGRIVGSEMCIRDSFCGRPATRSSSPRTVSTRSPRFPTINPM